MSDIIRFSVHEGCGRLHIDHPPVNALNQSAFAALDDYLAQAEENDDVRVVLITAAGEKAFVAGIDIKEVQAFTAEEMAEFNRISGRALKRIEALTKPVVAVVNGLALGAGFELALACDFRVAASNAVFGLPELSLGIIPGGGGTQRLTRLIGAARAKEVMMLGRSLRAQEAKALGLVCDIADLAALSGKADELAAKLLQSPKVALSQVKWAIQRALDVPLEVGLMDENSAFMSTFTSVDGQAGIQAFAQRRKPIFVGH